MVAPLRCFTFNSESTPVPEFCRGHQGGSWGFEGNGSGIQGEIDVGVQQVHLITETGQRGVETAREGIVGNPHAVHSESRETSRAVRAQLCPNLVDSQVWSLSAPPSTTPSPSGGRWPWVPIMVASPRRPFPARGPGVCPAMPQSTVFRAVDHRKGAFVGPVWGMFSNAQSTACRALSHRTGPSLSCLGRPGVCPPMPR